MRKRIERLWRSGNPADLARGPRRTRAGIASIDLRSPASFLWLHRARSEYSLESKRRVIWLHCERRFKDRLPRPDDAAEIVLLDAQRDYAARVLDSTRAWNPQQGTMLYWNPEAPESQFFFTIAIRRPAGSFTVRFDISADRAANGSGNIASTTRRSVTAVWRRKAAGLPPSTTDGSPACGRLPGTRKRSIGLSGCAIRPTTAVFKVDARSGEKRLLVSFKQPPTRCGR